MSYTTVKEWTTAIADAIRAKDGTEEEIAHVEFPVRIETLPVGLTWDKFVMGDYYPYIDAGNATRVESSTFFHNYRILEFSGENIESIESNAFKECGSLKAVICPKLQTVKSGAFTNCSTLKKLECPAIQSIGWNAFQFCTSLKNVDFPALTSLKWEAFYGSALQSFSAENYTGTIEESCFGMCDSLTNVDAPKVSRIETYAFNNTGVRSLEFNNLAYIGDYAFNGSPLTKLVLTKDTVCTLGGITAFNMTPIANGEGFVYVPDTLVEDYKTATNWAEYAAAIRPISELGA